MNHTLALLCDWFYWPQMDTDVRQHISICPHCIHFKVLIETAPLINIVTHCALELIHLDFLKLEPSVGQQEDILVITNYFM